MLETILAGIFAYAGTNVDDLFINTLYFAQADNRKQTGAVVVGKYLGIGALVIISLLGAFVLHAVPEKYIGILGLVPMALGIKEWIGYIKSRNASEDEEEQPDVGKGLMIGMALVTVAKLAAPMTPFMTESIYRNLVCSIDSAAPESIHLCDFPVADDALIDAELEANMEKLLRIVSLGRAARNEGAVKTRQPLAEMFINREAELPEFYVDIIREEMNVKKVTWAEDMSGFMSYSFKPQMKTLGPRFGKRLGEIREKLAALDGSVAMQELSAAGELKLDLGDVTISLAESDLLIEKSRAEGYASASDAEVKVAVSTTLTQALVDEGNVREVISKVQTMRKDAGFNVTDHIRLSISGGEELYRVVRENEKEICGQVLADEVVLEKADGFVKNWNINGMKADIGVEKL